MSKIILGLDLGITSIGWAVVQSDTKELLNNKILASGVRIFSAAEHPKTGESLALPRRNARSVRRTTKRKSQKIRAIKRLLIQSNIITQNELEHLFIGNKGQKDVWQLRRDGLYRLLNHKELSRVMIHLAKHRGYMSNRKSEAPTDNDGKAILSKINENQIFLQKGTYKTIGEYFATKDRKRNGIKDGKLYYDNSISRDMLVDEINLLFKTQKEFGSMYVNDTLLEDYKAIAFTQRPLQSVEHMVGNCPFEQEEKRASQSSISFLKFRAIQTLKHLRYIDSEGEHNLSKVQIEQFLYEALQQKTPRKYNHLRKFFQFGEEIEFKGLVYYDENGEKLKKSPEGVKLVDFSSYYKLKESIQKVDNLFWDKLEKNEELIDNIAYILTVEKNDDAMIKKLKNLDLPDVVCDALVYLSFSGFGHLSAKALKKINKEFLEAQHYEDACTRAGYDFRVIFQGKKSLLLSVLSEQENMEMTNPVVKRAVTQMRKVYNAIARKYGAIDAVHIELTRDIKKSFKDRKRIEKEQKDFRDKKEEAREEAIEILGHEPNGKELLKFRLWKEQGHHCIYSGEYIKPEILADSYATEIDHILPYSRSLDDSLNNKVLCLTKENQEKANQTPFEWMDEKRFYDFSVRIENLFLKKAKKERLLKKNFDENSENAFKERNKNDTSYISKFVKNYIEAHIEFKPSQHKRHVFTMNGMLTSQLRYKWGVGDKNRDNHLHHAEDAIILAFSTQSMVQHLSTVSAQREEAGFVYKDKQEKAKSLRFITPMDDFGKIVRENVEEIFVSHMPTRKIQGAAHKETVYSKKVKSKGVMEINGGVVENGEVKRIDVFEKNGKFHFIYLYSSDFVKKELKNITIKGLEVDESFTFKTSIFKNDLIQLELKDKIVFGYLKFAEGDGRFNIIKHKSSELNKKTDRHSTGSMKGIKKYQVDTLGSFVEVKQEIRQGTKKQKK